MKRLLVILVLTLLMASVVIIAGCGDSDNGGVKDGEMVTAEPLNVDEDTEEAEAEYSVNGTYESAEGTFITLMVDGTFETDAWGSMQEGTYMYSDDDMGRWVDLAFADGSSISLSVMIGNDEVAAIVDGDTGTQYTKK